ncbi:Uncharacterised protein [BD1-7 clade bacterium]|uniref:Uncharacterized protein n=1 Tax=BD1-7 clade bacterium TaxID=2029982 RepID=A0A5S9Q2L9_9GAMM|nr:Uncharacterised protein [BD1-7 clade bacterium]CAA0112180.1 Uncharacterised protein [BD1-7 clade bacterium]
MQSIILYHTVGCHLCEDAEVVLSSFRKAGVIDVTLVDIADDDALVDLYGIRIPVIRKADAPTEEGELGWPFDHDKVNEFLNF